MALLLAAWIALMAQASGQDVQRSSGISEAPDTAVIRGVVIGADTGLPLRRVPVALSGLAANRRAGVNLHTVTDDAGGYEFAGLPPGRYRIRAAPGLVNRRYLPGDFEPNGRQPGIWRLILGAGEEVNAPITLPRGSVIQGRVLTDAGEPVARASVIALRQGVALSGSTIQTDDQGRFRLFSLEPGDYVVRATPPTGPPLTEGSEEGFAITYYPSALDVATARRVRLAAAGTDVSGVVIGLVRSPLHTLSGIVLGSHGEIVRRPNFTLRSASGERPAGEAVVDESGRFFVRNLLPGRYQLVVSSVRAFVPASGSREHARMIVDVFDDIEGLTVTTAPGATIRGRVSFAEGAPSNLPGRLSVRAQPTDSLARPEDTIGVAVGEDLEFVLGGLSGPVLIRTRGLPAPFAIQSVTADGRDITDEPFEFSRSHEAQIEVVLTGLTGSVEGHVLDRTGRPAVDAAILFIPEPESSRRTGSVRLQTVFSLDGRFLAGPLLPGRYHAVAIPLRHFRAGPSAGSEHYNRFVPYATVIVVNAGEVRSLELQIVDDGEPER